MPAKTETCSNRVCTTSPPDRWRPESLAALSSSIKHHRIGVPITNALLYQLSYAG